MKIHIDIDCFFVSAVRTIEPELEGKPVAIGGRSDTKIFDEEAKEQIVNFKNSGNFVPTFYKAYEVRDNDIADFTDDNGRIRGILTTASYEARACGITTAMTIREALALCPELIVKAPNMSLYQELSHRLHEYLMHNIPEVEQASIDEFYGNLSGWIEDEEVAEFIDTLRHRIKKEFALPVSIGASSTKYIAKLATSFAKPFGSKVVYAQDIRKFVEKIPVQKFPGIGRRMGARFQESGIDTLGELLRRKERVFSLGRYAQDIYKRVSGEKDEPLCNTRKRKSIGISRTIDPLYDRMELVRRVHILSRHLCFAVMKLGVMPTTYYLSLRYEMNKKAKASMSSTTLFSERFFDSVCMRLLNQADTYKRLQVIRISIHCGSFTRDSKKELDLTTFEAAKKERMLAESTYKAREKYGLGILKWGSEL